jgi:hypothetical protein
MPAGEELDTHVRYRYTDTITRDRPGRPRRA